ncbi:MAG: hypothetical protein ACTHKU_06440 [Verrucomicrobiota bacterium]
MCCCDSGENPRAENGFGIGEQGVWWQSGRTGGADFSVRYSDLFRRNGASRQPKAFMNPSITGPVLEQAALEWLGDSIN